ncbi:MAG: hypothetical protein H6978_10830, partial [Gammaproteobacteria bacterium]|nr:hypothetical protein [Gammaproteobacteria bacterium]
LLIKTYESLGWTGAAEQARQKAAAVDPGRFAGEGPSENPIASARAAMADKDFSRATGILRSALAATPRDANLLVELADATVATNGFSFSSEANQLLSDALALNPNHPKALWLAGTAAYRAGDLDTAATHWQRFLKVVPPQSEEARIVAGNLREIGAAAPTAIPTSQTAPTTATATGSRVDGSVTLSAELMHRAGADATVFVFARSADGMPLPLAVRKYRVADLPLTFSLDDSMAMAAGRNLSSADTVVIGARISTSGNAIAQPGDLEGVSEPVEVAAAHDLNIVINREIQ